MGKKKPFIDRKKASTYHLMHRSQRDVSEHLMEGDTHASGMVLWPSPHNNPDINQKVLGQSESVMMEWRQKLQDAGLLDTDDQQQYLKEITGTGTFLNTNGRVANATEDWRAHDTAAKDLDMLEVKGQMDNIPLATALDEDMAAILYGDDDVDLGDFEELNDEFIFDAAKEPEDDGENAFDYDEHIRKLMEKAQREREGGEASDRNNQWAREDKAFFSHLKPLHERDSEDDDSFAEVGSEMGGTQAFTVMTTPGVVPKLSPDEEKALCEKFAETLLEYDSDEIGDDPYEEIGGDRPLEGDKFVEAALDEFLQVKDDEILIHGNREGRKGGSGYAVLVGKQMVPVKDLNPAGDDDNDEADNPPVQEILAQAQERLTEPHAKPPPEDVLIDGKSYFSEKIRNPWDCESILSTYSNLDNNPVTIGVGGRRRKRNKKKESNESVQQIQLSNKTGLPLGVFNTTKEGAENDDDDDESNYFDGNTTMSVNRGLARKKNETAEEKRARKAALKQERQMARIQKKVTREIFQEEFAKRAIALQADDVAGSAVFRYS